MAELHVLRDGYVREGDELRVGSTVGFVRDGEALIVIDPGMVTGPDAILLVTTDGGVVGFTHLWWAAGGSVEDPYTHDAGVLHANRARVLGLASEIVPGHGPRFVPDANTPR